MSSQIHLGASDYDGILGTPTSQQIIRWLSIWSDLSVKELCEKIGVSESQIHSTLRKLAGIGVVTKVRRGSYSLGTEPFVSHLKEAYLSNSTNLVNSNIYQIKQLLKRKEIEEAENLYNHLVKLYEPLLKERFSLVMHSLAHSFIDYYGIL